MKKATPEARHRTGYALALVVDLWVGVSAIMAMAICAFVQYLRAPALPLSILLSHHLQDLLILGVIFWAVSWAVLRIALVTPLQAVFAHLYRIGGGDRTPVNIHTKIREIGNIAESINVMLWRLNEQSDDEKLSRSHAITTEARAMLDDLSDGRSDVVAQVHNLLEQVQMLLRQSMQNRILRQQRAQRRTEINSGTGQI